MKLSCLILSILLSTIVFAQGVDSSQLEAMLDMDRFEFYTESWASQKMDDNPAMAKAVKSMTAEDIFEMKLDPKKLSDPVEYDGLILQILNKKHPELKATATDVNWGYNFFKNKLDEAYRLTTVKPRANAPVIPVADAPSQLPPSKDIKLTPLQADEVLLDVGGYASDRTTRAVFWEASANNRRIELHVGTAGTFQRTLALRGAKIIGEVKTKARNYNPIYLIQEPGEKGFHYAVTEISGSDRVKHFELQSALVRWKKSDGKVSNPPPVRIVGDPIAHMADQQRTLTQVLRTVPRADHIVIGQKGAFERTFGSIGKIRAIIDMEKKNKAALAKVFSEKEMILVRKAMEEGNDVSQFVMKYASDIDKLYEKATPLLTKNNLLAKPFNAFNYDRHSFEMSDYTMMGEDGKIQRWRIFSNVWGDEVLPIARALKATDYNRVTYIGTAGALDGSGLKVGDLIITERATDTNGRNFPLRADLAINPEGIKRVENVVNVRSPFEETNAWLKIAQASSDAVEVETGYLASVYTDPGDKVTTLLLISDEVGSEHATLAAASSSSRRRAQTAAISEVIEEGGVAAATSPVVNKGDDFAKLIGEIVPNRDPLSALQLYREAALRGANTRTEIEALIKSQKSFTTAKLEAALTGAEIRFEKLKAALANAGLSPNIAVNSAFLDGRFNPSVGGVQLHLSSDSKNDKKIKDILEAISKGDKDFKKFLDISVSSSPDKSFFTLPKDAHLLTMYEDGVLRFGGLAHTETTNGGFKFVKVTEPSKEKWDSGIQIASQKACSPGSIRAALDGLLK